MATSFFLVLAFFFANKRIMVAYSVQLPSCAHIDNTSVTSHIMAESVAVNCKWVKSCYRSPSWWLKIKIFYTKNRPLCCLWHCARWPPRSGASNGPASWLNCTYDKDRSFLGCPCRQQLPDKKRKERNSRHFPYLIYCHSRTWCMEPCNNHIPRYACLVPRPTH